MTCYSISQPYNAYSHNKSEPYFPDYKPVHISDKSDNKFCFDKDCVTVHKLCLKGDHYIPNLYTFLKHHYIPFQGDHNLHLKHYHNPCYSSHHDAAWYHAHDSGNTVVLNIPPYWGGSGRVGTRVIEVAGAEGAVEDLSEPIAAADTATNII